jgi:uncharacterized protein
MKTDLSHLPRLRQRQLEYVRRVLLEEFEKKTERGTQPWTRNGRILKIILFGSFARGDWVDDRRSGYLSDFDILVVVNHPRLTETVDYWEEAEDRLLRRNLANPRFPETTFILHDHADVNDQITLGRPFFLDIMRDGIVLYEAPGFPLATPGELPPDVAGTEASRNFDYWLPRVESAIATAGFCMGRGSLNDAAFSCHQAAERAYHCVLLTFALYSPKSHNIRFLRGQAEGYAPALRDAWPLSNRIARRRFELIKRAYIDARYSPHYRITEEELTWSIARLEHLSALVRSACTQHLAALGTDAGPPSPPS